MPRFAVRLIALSWCALAPLEAHAISASDIQSNAYASISGDYTWMHGDNGGGGNAALGFRFWPSNSGDFRLEGELGYHDVGRNSTHYFTYMGNLYYDVDAWKMSYSNWRLVPYVGGGLGGATVHFQHAGSGDAFAYQGMAGLTLRCDSLPSTDWSLGYRYVRSDETHGSRLSANNIELGVRFHI